MLFQGHSLGVALATYLTHEGALSCVESTVDYQRGGLSETLGTVLTLVWFFSWGGGAVRFPGSQSY